MKGEGGERICRDSGDFGGEWGCGARRWGPGGGEFGGGWGVRGNWGGEGEVGILERKWGDSTLGG